MSTSITGSYSQNFSQHTRVWIANKQASEAKFTEEQKKALNEREKALAEVKKTSRKRTKKEKDIIKTRITLAKSAFSKGDNF